MIPLFDSLAHPTVSGDWLGRGIPADFQALADDLAQAGFAGACAIGIDGVGGYSHDAFIERCRLYPNLIPVAGFDPRGDSSPESIVKLSAMGYRAVKIHPRFSGVTRHIETIGPALRAAGQVGMPVLLCTYMHCALSEYPAQDPFFALVELLRDAPSTRIVLVHGGDVNLLRYAELVRFNDNLLLDLSMTLMKYADSSVDLDIAFLFKHFDHRICIGTDWPEYRHHQVHDRFEHFGKGLPGEKRRNIAYRNLLSFLGTEDDFIGAHASNSFPSD